MEIHDLESYNLFQEISDTFILLSGFIEAKSSGLLVKETFLISKDNEVTLQADKTEKDKIIVMNWLKEKRNELIQTINECIKLTEENFIKFKSENPSIKEEIKIRIKDLKKSLRLLEDIKLDPETYDEYNRLKIGPDLNSDYAGISVKETKYFLI
jgi:hypothetical protein